MTDGHTPNKGSGKTIRLHDGRTIGYDEFGPTSGPAVFVFHGNPGSRLDVLFAGQAALVKLKAHLIAPDRPGIGLSSPQRRRRLVDWPADVNAIADVLGIDRYAVIGASAGGPYALACARFCPERLAAVGVMCSLGPPDAPPETRPRGVASTYFTLARLSPHLLRLQLWLMAQGLRDPDRMIKETVKAMPPPDQAFLAQPEAQQVLLATLGEGLRTASGLAQDATLVARPRDFRVHDITVPIHIWHGEDDRNSPAAMGHYLAQAIPNNQARFFAGEGHFSLIRYLTEMVDTLTA